MCCSKFWLKFISFLLAFGFGIIATDNSRRFFSFNKTHELVRVKNEDKVININMQENPVTRIFEEGSGTSGNCYRKDSPFNKNYVFVKPTNSKNKSLFILAKPRAKYTDEARQNNIQGTVTLRVAFLANGQVGSVSPVSGLPDGLTEQALAAAAQIKFNPATKNGKPVTVTKSVQYSFTIY